jgi:hypothetical protein
MRGRRGLREGGLGTTLAGQRESHEDSHSAIGLGKAWPRVSQGGEDEARATHRPHARGGQGRGLEHRTVCLPTLTWEPTTGSHTLPRWAAAGKACLRPRDSNRPFASRPVVARRSNTSSILPPRASGRSQLRNFHSVRQPFGALADEIRATYAIWLPGSWRAIEIDRHHHRAIGGVTKPPPRGPWPWPRAAFPRLRA